MRRLYLQQVYEERDVLVSKNKNNFKKARVVWFNDAKGFGYAEDGISNLIFVHYSSIASNAQVRRSLKEDQEIELQFAEELGELRATKVRDAGGHA